MSANKQALLCQKVSHRLFGPINYFLAFKKLSHHKGRKTFLNGNFAVNFSCNFLQKLQPLHTCLTPTYKRHKGIQLQCVIIQQLSQFEHLSYPLKDINIPESPIFQKA